MHDDLIFLQLRFSKLKFHKADLQIFLIFHPLQTIFIHYKSRIATAIRGL